MQPRFHARAIHRIAAAVVATIPLAVVTLMVVAAAPPEPVAPSLVLGEPRIVELSPGGSGSAECPAVRVLETRADGVLLECEVSALKVQEVTIEGQTYHVLEIEGGGVEGEIGAPMLPTFSRLVQIPAECGVTCEVTALETTELQGFHLLPMQTEQGRDFVIDQEAYARDGFGEARAARTGAPAIARELRVVPITFSPLRHDPSRDLLEVATRIAVDVRFTGHNPRNAKIRPSRPIPSSFDRLYGSLVVNYEPQRAHTQGLLGTYVLICPDNPQVVNALQPLIEWRTRQGFEVVLATTTETGTSAEEIKDWLEDAYNTWDNPPEFITLVGDASGGIALPCWWHAGWESDHPYVQLEGDDLLADAHLGRISVDSVDRLQLYVNKIVGYESTPYMQETDWYTHACVVGDPNGSGVTCIQVMQWLKIRLLDCGYTQVDTVFTSPFVSQILASVNQGISVFSYRGFYGTSGLSTGDISSLTNGWKMPFAVTITCGTGGYATGTCISEAWMRAGIPPSTPTGGIAAISTTGDTHTRYNNCMTYGIWRGVLWEDLHSFGPSLTRGKYELYLNYIPYDPSGCAAFTHWNNLMGDPAGQVWTSVPRGVTASHPDVIARGANSVTTIVTSSATATPLPGAYVCLWDGLDTHVVGVTGDDGSVELPVTTGMSDELRVTVTKHNCHPYLGTITVTQSEQFVGYLGHTIDDDAAGTSVGNGDGLLNPTEQIELPVQAHNFGTAEATGVTGTLTCEDDYVTILDDTEEFGDIAPGASVWSVDDFDLYVAGDAPEGHWIRLGLDLHSGTDTWHSLIDLQVTAAALVYEEHTLYGFGAEIDPGEDGEISVRIANTGSAAAQNLVGTLISDSEWLAVTDISGTFGTIGAGASGENDVDRFGIRADPSCVAGHLATLRIAGEFSGGTLDTLEFVLRVGTASTADPTGPDTHGYYAFDDTDVGYSEAPTYEWIEIDPYYSGPGTDVGLTDFGNDNDDSRTVDLPFPFVFYGEAFSRVTICSNGWLAMGATYLVNQRNWTIPGAGAPPYLIAPMWDDLYQSGSNRVYHWFDDALHRYIVEWSRVLTAEGNATQVFEVIFYDPAHYPTPTGDGVIVFQYHTFANTDWIQHYSTIGIQNEDQTDGVLFGYFNDYSPGATPITTGRAIKFTPFAAAPRGTLTGTITNATNGGSPVTNASVRVIESGQQFLTNDEGLYTGLLPIGIHTIAVSHTSFAPDTVFGVWISDGQTTVLDFSLEDIQPPLFTGTTMVLNTGDELGPYPVTSVVTDCSDLVEVTLHYNPAGTGWVAVPMEALGDDLYSETIPGQVRGSMIKYYLTAEDVGGLRATDPFGAPFVTYEFWVISPLFSDGMEAGAGDWTHHAVTDTMADQWHLSTLRNHTPGGTWSWKFGDAGAGTYADFADGALETAPIDLASDAVLAGWYWIDAEISQAYPGYAYDGGLVEMSVEGEQWIQITPVEGYPFLVREGSLPGPFPAETPIFSGTYDWTPMHFEIPGPANSVRFRFRFGSDGAMNQEGWYLDDVELVSAEPGMSDAPGSTSFPTAIALHPSRPNPFDASRGLAQITFDLPQASRVRLDVCDASGRRVRSLIRAEVPAGRHVISWDGRDPHGRIVESGVYFFVIDAAQERLTRKLLLVR